MAYTDSDTLVRGYKEIMIFFSLLIKNITKKYLSISLKIFALLMYGPVCCAYKNHVIAIAEHAS